MSVDIRGLSAVTGLLVRYLVEIFPVAESTPVYLTWPAQSIPCPEPMCARHAETDGLLLFTVPRSVKNQFGYLSNARGTFDASAIPDIGRRDAFHAMGL